MNLKDKLAPHALPMVLFLALAGWMFFLEDTYADHAPTVLVSQREQGECKSETPSQKDIVDTFHRLWYVDPNTWKQNRFLGIPTLQNPMDVWIHQEIIVEVKPDFVIDVGTYQGGSALIWATVLGSIHPEGRVITIDINDNREVAAKLPIWEERVEFLKGSSTSDEIVSQVKERVAGKSVVVVLDSNHSTKHVLNELRLYSPLVQVGAYIIVQDSNWGGNPIGKGGEGPMGAIDAFLAGNEEFAADKTRERLHFTFCPSGYLKRVKEAPK